MRKVAIGLTGAVLLLLAGLLASNTEATPLTGTMSVQPWTNYSSVEKADCDKDDPICKKGMTLACNPGDPQPYCECNQEDCSPAESLCPSGYKCCVKLGRWICG
jgi:hypothetical protein